MISYHLLRMQNSLVTHHVSILWPFASVWESYISLIVVLYGVEI